MKHLWGFGLFVALAVWWSTAAQPTRIGAYSDPALWIVRSGDATVNLFGRMAVGNDTPGSRPRLDERSMRAMCCGLRTRAATGTKLMSSSVALVFPRAIRCSTLSTSPIAVE